jgi:hypothetical protein
MSESSLASNINQSIEDYLCRAIDAGALSKLDDRESASYLHSKMKEHVSKKIKNFENLYREYEREKWNVSLQNFSDNINSTILSARECYRGEQTRIVLRFKKNLYTTDLGTARNMHIYILETVFRSFVKEVGTLVEIGAGDGGTLLPLLDHTRDLFPEAVALDLSPSGLKKIDLVSKLLNYDVKTKEFNLERDNLCEQKIPELSTILTSFTLCCIPELSEEFFISIAESKPRFVVHFEPMYEALEQEESTDQLGRKYIEVNDYNTNFLSKLDQFLNSRKDFEVKFKLDVFFGQNPLLPGSVICWGRKN